MTDLTLPPLNYASFTPKQGQFPRQSRRPPGRVAPHELSIFDGHGSVAAGRRDHLWRLPAYRGGRRGNGRRHPPQRGSAPPVVAPAWPADPVPTDSSVERDCLTTTTVPARAT